MEKWRQVWRIGFAPQLSDGALDVLWRGLAYYDRRIKQGITFMPRCLPGFEDEPPTAACPLAFAGWQGDRLGTVGEVEEYFEQLCSRAGGLLDDAEGYSEFLVWIDRAPQGEMRTNMLRELEHEMARRKQVAVGMARLAG